MAALRPSSDVGVLLLDRRRASPPAPVGLAWWRRHDVPWSQTQVDWMRRPDGHPAYGRVPEDAVRAIDESLRDFDPDVVVIGGLWFHGHLPGLRGRGRQLVLDAADVEGQLEEVQASAAPAGERTIRAILSRHLGVIEGEAAGAVDQLWACSGPDAEALRSRYPGAAPVTVVPNTVDADALRRPAGATRRDAPAVVYPATFEYAPNHDAALTLVRDIHPLVRQRFPGATLTLVGAGASQALRDAAAQVPGVTVTGPVSDTRPWLWESTVLAVPLRAGSGTRIKVLEAFAAGLPVVTTAKGVEGIDAVDGEHVLVADSPRQFADAIATVHDDAEAAAALAGRARRLVEARYSTEAARLAVEA
ncbi:MAG TPA: glycosyltransferase, partial [Acidimicrobiales bacterium]|nr:glycosyltransferase [Acidimicrobiales bacterium]